MIIFKKNAVTVLFGLVLAGGAFCAQAISATDDLVRFNLMGQQLTSAQQKDLDNYSVQVILIVRRHWIPPKDCNRRPIVRFEIAEDGKVSKIRLEQTAGNTVCDKPALDAVLNSALPKLPEGVKGVQASLTFDAWGFMSLRKDGTRISKKAPAF